MNVAGLARSTFFYHQPRLQAPDPEEKLKAAVTEIFETNHGRYGHRRVHTELSKQGWTVAKKTVLKLMQELETVEPELVWSPPWTPDRMSEDAKFILGIG